jgi:hypothetical protein
MREQNRTMLKKKRMALNAKELTYHRCIVCLARVPLRKRPRRTRKIPRRRKANQTSCSWSPRFINVIIAVKYFFILPLTEDTWFTNWRNSTGALYANVDSFQDRGSKNTNYFALYYKPCEIKGVWDFLTIWRLIFL